jgi:quercetin dioxygenase-like cupin family protein
MHVVNNADLPFEQMYPLVKRKELIGKKMGAANATIGEIIIDPGGEIPLHKHNVEDCILLREGTGEVHIDDQCIKVKAPMSILIPAGVKHKVLNTGSQPIRIIFCFPAVEIERQLL